LRPVVQRNRLEQQTAADIRAIVPTKATVFAFDLDIAMRSYLPDLNFQNLWTKQYDQFPPGSWVLFNEPLLRPQWQGKNPILNWDFLQQHYQLEDRKTLLGGWHLYFVK
jgi:hypothetical protein